MYYVLHTIIGTCLILKDGHTLNIINIHVTNFRKVITSLTFADYILHGLWKVSNCWDA